MDERIAKGGAFPLLVESSPRYSEKLRCFQIGPKGFCHTRK